MREGFGKFVRRFHCGLSYLVFCVAALSANCAFANDYALAPAPDWITPVELGKENAELLKQISDGEYFLLVDAQTRATSAGKTSYHRFARKAINAEGVESIANIRIVFNPSYQHLVLHSIDVVRDGRVDHRLAKASVQVVQREKELERQIYDGSKTANVFLEDVRIGDVVDYAYSLEGRNPVFNGLDFGEFHFQYRVPLARVHARLLVPSTRPVAIAPHRTELKAAVRDESGIREYVWNASDIAAVRWETDTPAWYDPYASVQWSEFADWSAVAAWARPLYQVPAALSADLLTEVERIRSSESTSAGRMLAALRFVQTRIRYLGVEIGAGSHAPNPPSTVLARRFGDCKDKTLLTLTLLRRLGIDAQAALVNTDMRRSLADMQPTPALFDHVLVHASVDGKSYWLDPTRSSQAGDLEHLYQPDFELALLVGSQTNSLTSMKNASGNFRKTMHAQFDASGGLDKPVHYTMTVTVGGESAESLRYSLASSNRDELQKHYLDYYAKYYAGIRVLAPMTIVDDAVSNTITTTESYEIPDFSSAKDKRHSAEIAVPDVDELLRAPASTDRIAPLNVKRHPVDILHTTDVLLPSDGWDIKSDSTRVDDPAFTYERTTAYSARRLSITDKYKSHMDAIAPADVIRYASNLAKARGESGFSLTWNDTGAEKKPESALAQLNWPVMMVGLFALAGWIWLARRAYRYDPPPRAGRTDRFLSGIRGWLLLPSIGTIITPLVLLAGMRHDINAMRLDNWMNLTTPGGSNYHAMWAPTLLFDFVINLGQIVFSILLAILFAKRRSSTPTIYIGFLIVSIAVQVVDQVLVGIVSTTADSEKAIAVLMRGTLSATIWTAYFLNSVRVRSTFVERLVPAAEAESEISEPAVA